MEAEMLLLNHQSFSCLNMPQCSDFLIHFGKVPAKQKLQGTSRLTPVNLLCYWLYALVWFGTKGELGGGKMEEEECC